MIDIKDIKVGNCIMYKNRACKVINIDSNENKLWIKNIDGCFYGPKCEDIEPIEINADMLILMGYDEIYPGIYADSASQVTISYDDRLGYYNIKIKKDNIVFADCYVGHVHEMQNLINHYIN